VSSTGTSRQEVTSALEVDINSLYKTQTKVSKSVIYRSNKLPTYLWLGQLQANVLLPSSTHLLPFAQSLNCQFSALYRVSFSMAGFRYNYHKADNEQ